MEIYQNKPRIKLSPTVRHGRKFIEVSFDHDGLRLPLSKEEGVQLVGGRAYLPEESFVLAEFFDRYVKMAFIDYSAIKAMRPGKRKTAVHRCPLAIWKNSVRCDTATTRYGYIPVTSGIFRSISGNGR